MKRYWKLIVLVAVIVLTIGTFYIRQSLASSNYPEMELETKSGDEKVADNLVLNTDIGIGKGSNIDVTRGGSTAEKDSFLSRIRGYNQDAKILRLQQDHRNFMRGKSEASHLFAQDKNAVVYADLVLDVYRSSRQNYDMNIDWLDKKTGDRFSFDVLLPDHEKYSDAHVEHVYIAGDQVKVVTKNRKNETDASGAELHVYTIDRDAEKIVDDDTVLTGSENMDNDDWVDIYTFANEKDQKKNDGLILTRDKGTHSESESDANTDPSERQVFYYDLQSGKRKKLSLPNELQEQAIEVFHGTTLYFDEQKDGKATISAYDVNDQKITANRTVQIPDSMRSSGTEELLTPVNDGKFYIVSDKQKKKQDTTVIVVDIKSGETVYEGTITMDDAIEDYDLDINGVTFKDKAGDND